MPDKSVSVQVLVKDYTDPQNPVLLTTENAEGTTPDDGQTIAVPLGYLPSFDSVPASDIVRIVHQPPVELPAPSAKSPRSDDQNTGFSTLSFS